MPNKHDGDISRRIPTRRSLNLRLERRNQRLANRQFVVLFNGSAGAVAGEIGREDGGI